MNQAVHAADIHERTVVGQALTTPVLLLADLHIGPELLALGVVLGGQDLADGTHDGRPSALLHLQAFVSPRRYNLAMAQRGLGARHEHAHVIHQHHNAAGVGLVTRPQDLAA